MAVWVGRDPALEQRVHDIGFLGVSHIETLRELDLRWKRGTRACALCGQRKPVKHLIRSKTTGRHYCRLTEPCIGRDREEAA